VPRLPAGKSIRIPRLLTLDMRRSSYFDITVTGKTVDGLPLSEDLFVSVS
jgi:hypothetical protein